MAHKVLFLDLNGTVIDDWNPSYAGVRAIFDHYELPCPTLASFIRGVAHTGDYHGFYVQNGIDVSRDELYTLYIPAYHAHQDAIELVPGVHEALERIRNAGVEIHIVTAARKDFAEHLIDKANIAKYCEGFHYHVHDKHSQIRAIIHGMNVRPTECAMIGDLPSDVHAANRAGISGIGFMNRHVPPDVFENVPMKFRCEQFSELPKFLL
ncbi:MAG: hypothetical protein A2408_00120 [Candidatus Yonathbacteria bacterium RIFOXYC1_FULL_52_10]|uniref:HAD family hydrolase n=1 Tax=Candidatus Yonathbacteria bacterium RIFOXYD1_FULL_52_36 TaxID=1802730 RepID=A0A1G2SL98_9BACT|nr:MAG: hypothetical protein A2408_00120 [Candidatus Yonathbacteria bacterium RIFOXYC1_FULL_52_10]OHA85488.1 MAG: hypothetical protein A2591_01370 [Candidatus Yonathbacteria bacterium RIFOXYD1_FULL_52_36]